MEKIALHTVEPIQWTAEGVVILDQLKLPGEVVYHTYTDYRDVARAIKTMIIRGAPAIGVAAAMGVALGVKHSNAKTLDELQAEFPVICETLAPPAPPPSIYSGPSLASNRNSKNWRQPLAATATRRLDHIRAGSRRGSANRFTKNAAQEIAASANSAPRLCPRPAA